MLFAGGPVLATLHVQPWSSPLVQPPGVCKGALPPPSLIAIAASSPPVQGRPLPLLRGSPDAPALRLQPVLRPSWSGTPPVRARTAVKPHRPSRTHNIVRGPKSASGPS
ncbi:hypothetical protein NDU88_003922 [Pleurodeles waltl]|uniref:Uncharacterized protein n=1 Tax=Pleurodeles waltl TaxID=8319 RepID=A0AAV7MRZ2_PLEWA|nr:hypothetical protein NDU88_003922 [Pleurodeles waltl]